MHRPTLFGLASIVMVSLAVPACAGAGHAGEGPGGSGGSGGSGGGSSKGGAFNCDYKEAGYEYCYSYTGLTAEQTTAEQDACGAYPGSSTPSSCPSANQSGCCENVTEAGINFGYCLYDIPATSLGALQMACETEK